MDDQSGPLDHSSRALSADLTIVGLGPGGLTGTPTATFDALMSGDVTVIVRTLHHPACQELAEIRAVETCDDLYERSETFDDVYVAIAARVMAAGKRGRVIYAVPGSPLYAERSVVELRERVDAMDLTMEVWPAPSFIDAAFEALAVDPGATGFQVLDGRDLPDPMMLHLPTLVFHVDVPLVLGEVVARLGRTLPDEAPVTVLSELGSVDADVSVYVLSEIPLSAAGYRSSLYFEPPQVGVVGAIATMRRLREECPWDRQQTHETLAPFAIEETFELVEAISHLPPGSPDVDEPDFGAYAEVEDELGDVLLQVIFHANLASEVGAFDFEDVAETSRRKLVRRHPHVFGDVEVTDADEVVANWQAIKSEDKAPSSLMDGVPNGSPGLMRAVKLQQRASRVGFDWPSASEVVRDVEEELAELVEVLDQPEAADELGDVLFAAANLARHLDVDPEVALRRAVARFESRFRRMEELGDLEAADADGLNRLWEIAKAEERDGLDQ